MTDANEPQQSSQTEDINLQSRVKEMQEQVGTLSALTTITLLLTLLMVVLYILDVMCRPRIRQKSLRSPNLPTAVVIQPKDGEDEEKRETKPKDGSGRAECKHNSNRHFPSKTVTFELDVKKAEVEKQLKEKEREKATKKSAAAMVSVPLDAPPTYAESKKDVILTSNVMPSNVAEKQQLVAKEVQISDKPNQVM